MTTEGSWRAAPSPITSTSIYDGEHYDATKRRPGWYQPGFDDSAWKAVTVASDTKANMVAQVGPPDASSARSPPVEVT